MIIKRRMYLLKVGEDNSNSINYRIIAETIDEAIAIVRAFRKDCNILSIYQVDDVVLTKEDVKL